MGNVSLRYFEAQPRAMTKQLQWYDTLALLDLGISPQIGLSKCSPIGV
jgi:hypothetical protein